MYWQYFIWTLVYIHRCRCAMVLIANESKHSKGRNSLTAAEFTCIYWQGSHALTAARFTCIYWQGSHAFTFRDHMHWLQLGSHAFTDGPHMHWLQQGSHALTAAGFTCIDCSRVHIHSTELTVYSFDRIDGILAPVACGLESSQRLPLGVS